MITTDMITSAFNNKTVVAFLVSTVLVTGVYSAGYAQEINTGYVSGSTIGSNNATCLDTNTCINGSADGSLINNVGTNVQTGSNTNQNYTNTSVNPVLYSPASSSGGNSALVMPRNPLMMQNASLGRSALQIQFGANSNPLSGLTGNSSAMGWFAQMGLNIPFGKVPDVISNQHNRKYDDSRAQQIDADRDVFGRVASASTAAAKTTVSGQFIPSGNRGGLNAYNYGTIPTGKVTVPDMPKNLLEMTQPTQPKVLALEPSTAYSHPLNTGDEVGLLEVGREYPYLGHTKSGWVKVLLPKGVEAWAQARFEYIKNDYTEIDTLAFDKIPAAPRQKVATAN